MGGDAREGGEAVEKNCQSSDLKGKYGGLICDTVALTVPICREHCIGGIAALWEVLSPHSKTFFAFGNYVIWGLAPVAQLAWVLVLRAPVVEWAGSGCSICWHSIRG